MAVLLQQVLGGSVSATLPWTHVPDPETLRTLLEEAGLVDVEIHS